MPCNVCRSKLYRAPEEVKRISPLSVREQARCPQLKRDRDSDSNNSEPLSEAKKNKLLTCLSAEQRAVFDAVLSGQNVFFTGKAGTGKSFLLQTLIQALPTQGTVITASTGVAACNISGAFSEGLLGCRILSWRIVKKKSITGKRCFHSCSASNIELVLVSTLSWWSWYEWETSLR